MVTGGALLSLDENRVLSIADLAGQAVAVTAGTTTEAILKSAMSEASIEAEIVSVASPQEGLSALDDRDVAAYASDQVVLIGQVLSQEESDENYYLSGDFFSYEPYALAIKRGDPDFALVADRTISRLFRTGQITSIYEESFGRFGLSPADALLTLYDLLAIPE